MRTREEIEKEIEKVTHEVNFQDTIQSGLKIANNGSYGKMGSMYSSLYSPETLLQVTLTGQLVMLMLIETLEKNGFKVVSSNTDGVEYVCEKDKIHLAEALIFEWELDTKLVMEHGQYDALYARDVNNYVAVYPDEVKAKGVYAKPTLSKNSEYPIVFEAIRRYLFDNMVSLEETITECMDVRQFLTSRTVKTGGVWKPKVLTETTLGSFMSGPTEFYEKAIGTEGGIYLGKVVRWYYAKDGNSIHYKNNGNKVPKSDGAHPMMELSDSLPLDLDYDKYIELAIGHLEDTGVKYEWL